MATVLGFTCVAGGLCCAVLSGLQFAQLSAQERGERNGQLREAQWSEALLAWAYHDTPLPQPLDQAGAETLLKLRDTITGEHSDKLQDLYAQEGWLARDLTALARPYLSVVARAQIIERLALLREARALDALSHELTHPHREIRALALLALSRSVGRLNLGHDDRQTRTLALHTAIIRGQFSVGQVQEALTLLGDAGHPLARNLLTTGTLALRVATLEVLSRQRSSALHDDVTGLLYAGQDELRAGALKVFVRSGQVPAEAAAVVLALTADPTSFVRLQATRAAAHLTPVLWSGCGCSWATGTGGCGGQRPRG
ncbi:hypothetical protein ACFSC4_24390 [Deinococcus malanensis]|uniref:hypothetical protein n=1 Tax=Deinococcus malanensis TaxID=1706855 RepID=UPI00363AA180